MKKLILLLFLIASPALAVTLKVNVGGTGSTTLSGILIGNGLSPIGSLQVNQPLFYRTGILDVNNMFSTTSAAYWLTQQTYLANNLGDWAGTWQTHNAGDFQLAGAYLTGVTADSPLGGSGTAASHLTCTGCLTSLVGAASSTLLGDTNIFSASTTFTKNVFIFSGATTSSIYSSASSTFASLLNVGGTLTAQGLTIYGTPTFKAASIATAALVSSTISGISLGSNLNSISVSNSLSGTSYNGSASVSDWAVNMANANSWTALQTFNNISTMGATSTSFYASASSTIANTLNLSGSFYISPAGKLGIGTTSPASTLTVNGSGFFEASSGTTTLHVGGNGTGVAGCIELRATNGIMVRIYATSTPVPISTNKKSTNQAASLRVEQGSCNNTVSP